MGDHTVVLAIFLIFTGAAILATFALFARQTLLVAYIGLGLLIGPYSLGWVDSVDMVKEISHIGITFLLFLLGLNMAPQKLLGLFKKTAVITILTCLFFAAGGAGIVYALGFSMVDSLIVGAALMFSSTIIGLKLLPTTVLHHRLTGELMISILLLQDLIAIAILLAIESQGGLTVGNEYLRMALGVPSVAGLALLAQRYVLTPLFARYDQFQEYIFLVVIGWCLGMAEAGAFLGLSTESGAFIAGVALAASPIANYIAEVLRPLRDFFLVIFFFSIGATYNWHNFGDVLLPSLLLVAFITLSKPWLFRVLLTRADIKPERSKEIGVRLGNISEFSLLISVLALTNSVITETAASVIQTTTLITFIISSYWIVLFYPSPMAISDELRQQ